MRRVIRSVLAAVCCWCAVLVMGMTQAGVAVAATRLASAPEGMSLPYRHANIPLHIGALGMQDGHPVYCIEAGRTSTLMVTEERGIADGDAARRVGGWRIVTASSMIR